MLLGQHSKIKKLVRMKLLKNVRNPRTRTVLIACKYRYSSLLGIHFLLCCSLKSLQKHWMKCCSPSQPHWMRFPAQPSGRIGTDSNTLLEDQRFYFPEKENVCWNNTNKQFLASVLTAHLHTTNKQTNKKPSRSPAAPNASARRDRGRRGRLR